MKENRNIYGIIRKYCSLILALVMTFSFVSACSGEKNTTGNKKISSSQSSSKESEASDKETGSSEGENSSGNDTSTSTDGIYSEDTHSGDTTYDETSGVSGSSEPTKKTQSVSSATGAASQVDRNTYMQKNLPRGDMIKKLSDLKKSDICFGYYGAFLDEYGFKSDVDAMVQSDYANTFFCFSGNCDYSLKIFAENNSKAWVPVSNIYMMICRKQEGWEEVFDVMVAKIKKTGYWDAVLGWYLDEPSNHEAVLTLTKYAKEKYNKRFFICYLACSMAPHYATLGSLDTVGISERTTKYVTDIGYDLYWNVNTKRNVYDYVNSSMHKLLGKNNPKIWYTPYIAFWGSVLEASEESQRQTNLNQTAHLELMYEFLKQEKNPGGIMCYAYDIADPSAENQYGIKEANQLTEGAFQSLLQRSTAIGREICTGKTQWKNKK